MQNKNLCVSANGAKVYEFSSQYHHESRACNILIRDPTYVWFSSYHESLPQYLILELNGTYSIKRVGIYLHGENVQNPKVIQFYLGTDPANLKSVLKVELEHRAGDHIFELDEAVEAKYVKAEVHENFGGSGTYISKIFAFLPVA